jgi:sorbitol-specific phosphotransferase system component IIC
MQGAETIKSVLDATGGMSVTTFLGIVTALVAVITTLGEIIKLMVQKKMNPLNGTLSKLETR